MIAKNNWQTKKLGEVLKLEYGKPLQKLHRKSGGLYPVYGANGIKSFSDKFYYDKATVIVGRKGSAGEINLTEEKFWPLDVTYFVKFDDKKYDLKFLYNLLDTLELTKLAKGVKPGINRDDVYDIDVQVPELNEQRRIVKILDEVFEKTAKAKANAEKNIQNAKNLFESYLQSVFDASASPATDWEKKSLGDIFQIKPPKKEAKEKLKDDDLVSFVPMEDLEKFSKEFACVKERKLRDVAGSYTYFANEDVLLAKITPCFENGKLGIARNLKNGIGFGSSEYIVFRSSGNVIPDYLYYFLARDYFRTEGAKRMSGAVGHKRVSKEFIEETILPFPKSLPAQKSIVVKFDALSEQTKKLESIYKQKLADLEELKKSVLKKAFSGEL